MVYRQKGNPAKRHQLPFWQSLLFSCQKGNHSLSKRQPLKNRLFCYHMKSLACYIVMDCVKLTCTILVSVVSQEWTHILSLRWISTLMTTFGHINIVQPCNTIHQLYNNISMLLLIQAATMPNAATTPGFALSFAHDRKIRGAQDDCRPKSAL